MPIYKGFMVKVMSELLAEEADHKKKRNLAKLPLGKLQQSPLCIINSCRSKALLICFPTKWKMHTVCIMQMEKIDRGIKTLRIDNIYK